MKTYPAHPALQARRLEADKDLRRRQRLMQVVARAHSDALFRRDAWEQVGKWEQGALCSPEYIAFWRAVLASPQPFQASLQLLQRQDADARRLIGNSPFLLAA